MRIDQLADKGGADLYRFSKLYDFPDFVKSASMPEALQDGPHHTAFADPVSRQFPCDDRASTWLSALYFEEKQAELAPADRARVKAAIDRHAAYFRVAADVRAMRARHAGLNKSADDDRPDSDYAVVWTGADGTRERSYRLSSAAEVKAAADWLLANRDRMAFADRHAIALKVLEKQAAFGASLGGEAQEALERAAGRGVCDPEKVAAMIEVRAHMSRNEALRDQVVKLAECVRTQPREALSPENMVKLAETVDVVDDGLRVAGKYTDMIPRPEDVIFEVTFGKAAEAVEAHVPTTSGSVYAKADFAKLSAADVRDVFGDDFAERVSTPLGVDPEKMAEEAGTLPLPDAETLDGLLSDRGVYPVMSKRAEFRPGRDAALRGLAEAYSKK